MIAKLIYQCPQCHDLFGEQGDCPKCGCPLEPTAAINAYELPELIKRLATPEGIVKAMVAAQKWLET